MLRVLPFLFLSTLLVFSQTQTDIVWPTLAESDWPMIKHDPQFTGRSPYQGPQTPNIVWSENMPNGIFSGPVLGEQNNLYFGSYCQWDSTDYFYSFDKEGNKLWEYRTLSNRPPQSGVLADSSNTIYFGSIDSNFYAINDDGTLKWKCKLGDWAEEATYPNIDLEGNLYITQYDGHLNCISSKGELLWSKKYGSGFRRKSPAISPDGETVYIIGADSNMYAIHRDGSLKWGYKWTKSAQFSPLVDNAGNVYYITGGVPQSLHCIRPDGTARYVIPLFEGAIPVYSTPTIDYEGNLYFICKEIKYPLRNRHLISYDYEGNFRWSYSFDFDDDNIDYFTQPLICDNEGTIYVGTTHGKKYYAISSEGKLKWELALNDLQVDNTGVIGSDGTLYLGVHVSSLSFTSKHTLIAIRDTVTSVSVNKPLPNVYTLEQNYSNPFNQITNIKFNIPANIFVTIKVYNISGQLVSTLINESLDAGMHSVNWNADKFASGVYFYTIKAGEFFESKKMLLLK